MKRILKTTVALLLFCGDAAFALCRTQAQQRIETLKNREALETCVWGVFATKMNGDTIADVRRRQKMVPASNVKLLTTGLALKALGPEFRYETKIACNGTIEDGVLNGDLYIIGGGDPTTGSKADCARSTSILFKEWADIIRNAGISRIQGNVIGDPRFFSSLIQENPGWLYEDLGSFDGSAPQGLNFYENTQNLAISPGPTEGSRPSIRTIYPETPWMTYINNAVTADSATPNTVFYSNGAFGAFGAVNGKFPMNRGAYGLDCDNQFGAYTCAYYFYNYLKRNGIPVSGGFADIDIEGCVRQDLNESPGTGTRAASEPTILGSTFSAPLSEIVDETNRYSNNFYAETLLHTIGQTFNNSSEYYDCLNYAKRLFYSMGLARNKTECNMVDGSGLSRKNYISPEFFVQFLTAMAKEKCFDAYMSSLPQPGKKGTMHGFMPKNEDLRGRVHCKTGSMNGVLCYSGYIEASDGNPRNMIVFSLMTNNSTTNHWTVRAVLEEIVTALCKEN